jgi:hypothetical protein
MTRFATEEAFAEYLRETLNASTREGLYRGLLRLRLPTEVADRRASILSATCESLAWYPEIQMDRWPHRYWYMTQGLPMPLPYHVPDPQWGSNKGPQKAFRGEGSTTVDLVYLSRCCEIAHELLPKQWPVKLRKDFSMPQEHSNLLNEIWWLGRFRDPTHIEYEPGSPKKCPDWGMSCGPSSSRMRLEIEVKRRPSTLRTFAGQDANLSLFDDIAAKFKTQPSTPFGDQALRIGCITIYTAITTELRVRCRDWLAENRDQVDGLFCFSLDSGDSAPQMIMPAERESLFQSLLLNPLTDEDLSSIGEVARPVFDISPVEYAARVSAADRFYLPSRFD